MTDSKRLTELIQASGLKQNYIAETLGISRYALYKKINNKTGFTPDQINVLCDLLHITKLSDRFAIFFAKTVDLKSTEKEE